MKKKLLVLVTVLWMMIVSMTACGTSYANLEDYYTKNQAVFEAAMGLEAMKSQIPEGIDFNVAAQGDEFIITYIIDDSLLANLDVSMIQTELDNVSTEMKTYANQFKDEAKIDKAVITLAYQDSAGNELASASAESD